MRKQEMSMQQTLKEFYDEVKNLLVVGKRYFLFALVGACMIRIHSGSEHVAMFAAIVMGLMAGQVTTSKIIFNINSSRLENAKRINRKFLEIYIRDTEFLQDLRTILKAGSTEAVLKNLNDLINSNIELINSIKQTENETGMKL